MTNPIAQRVLARIRDLAVAASAPAPQTERCAAELERYAVPGATVWAALGPGGLRLLWPEDARAGLADEETLFVRAMIAARSDAVVSLPRSAFVAALDAARASALSTLTTSIEDRRVDAARVKVVHAPSGAALEADVTLKPATAHGQAAVGVDARCTPGTAPAVVLSMVRRLRAAVAEIAGDSAWLERPALSIDGEPATRWAQAVAQQASQNDWRAAPASLAGTI